MRLMHDLRDGAEAVDALRARVARVCRVLGGLDLMKAATGHASARLPGTDRVFIRGRGDEEAGLRFTMPEQIVEVDLSGRLVESLTPGVEAPREVFIHTSVYRQRPEVFGVVHGHPLTVVLMSMSGKPLLPLHGAYDPPSARLAIQGIPIYPRTYLCDTPARGDELAEAIGASSCCIMRGHGSTTCGPNVEEAALTTIHLNDLADINYKAAMIGGCESIPDDERDWILSGERFAASTQNGAHPQGRAGSLWRYYCSVAGEAAQ
jgi:ribulose-5-phosphate 4-epimerase/fuculose-1-phosphate aldolase